MKYHVLSNSHTLERASLVSNINPERYVPAEVSSCDTANIGVESIVLSGTVSTLNAQAITNKPGCITMVAYKRYQPWMFKVASFWF